MMMFVSFPSVSRYCSVRIVCCAPPRWPRASGSCRARARRAARRHLGKLVALVRVTGAKAVLALVMWLELGVRNRLLVLIRNILERLAVVAEKALARVLGELRSARERDVCVCV